MPSGCGGNGQNEDGSYDGTFLVKLGPTSASYAGKLKLEHVDESARRATIQANGTDRRGHGGARATIVSTVTPVGDGAARVEVVTECQITGRLAHFVRGGMIDEISERLLKEFAERLQALRKATARPTPRRPRVEPRQVGRTLNLATRPRSPRRRSGAKRATARSSFRL